MQLKQILFYWNNTLEISHSHLINELKKNEFQFIIISSKTANCFGTISQDCSLLVTNMPDGSSMAQFLNIPFIGQYIPHSFFDYSNAISLFETLDGLSCQYLEQQWCRAHNLPVVIATTERIIIQELTCENIADIYTMYHDPKNMHFTPSPTDSLQEEIKKHKQYIKYCYKFFGYGLWGIFNKKDKLIGHGGIQNFDISLLDSFTDIFPPDSAIIELSYMIDYKFQGQGYGREAVFEIIKFAYQELEIQQLYCIIAKNNVASIKLAMDMGFHPLGDCMYKGFFCQLYQSSPLSNWIIEYNKLLKRRKSSEHAWIHAQKNPVQSVYKRIY